MVHNRSQPSHNKSIVYGAGGHLVTSSAFLKRSPAYFGTPPTTSISVLWSPFSTLKFAPKTVLNRRPHWWCQHWRVCTSYLGAGVLLLQMLLCQIGPETEVVSFKCFCWTRTERRVNVMARHSYPLFIKWLFWELPPTDRPILIRWLQHTQHLLTYWSLSPCQREREKEREGGRNGCYLIDQLQKFCPSIFSCSRRNLRCVSWVQWVFKSQDSALVFASLPL